MAVAFFAFSLLEELDVCLFKTNHVLKTCAFFFNLQKWLLQSEEGHVVVNMSRPDVKVDSTTSSSGISIF